MKWDVSVTSLSYFSVPNWGASVKHPAAIGEKQPFRITAANGPTLPLGIRQYMLNYLNSLNNPSGCLTLQPHVTQTLNCQSTLTLFVFWILTDYSDRSFSFNDLAFFADRLYRWSYFHWKSSFRKFIKICSFLSAQIQYTHAFGLYIITAKYKMQALFWIKSHFFIFSPDHPFILPTANIQRIKIIHFMCICRHLRYS